MMKHLNEEIYSLDGAWQLSWAANSDLCRNGQLRRGDPSLSTPALSTRKALQQCGYESIAAQVPGNFELDLFRAGKCEDPFYADNVLSMQKYECMHQYYSRTFSFRGDTAGMELCFEGIDTAAEIFLNGRLLLECENMFVEHTVPVAELLQQGENELLVHIKPATLYARRYGGDQTVVAQYYNYDSLYLRKAAGMYGWDILPRIVSGGIWRSVSLRRRKAVRINDLFGSTVRINFEKNIARLSFVYDIETDADELSAYALEVEGVCGESRFYEKRRLWNTKGRVPVTVSEPRLWYPRNYGSPELYHVTVRLWCNGEVADALEYDMGIRMVELDRTSVVEPDGTRFGKGQFRFLVNEKPIFAMGTNWVPVDAFHSRDRERLPAILPMLNDLGCNMIRMWGGNVYEHEDVFDFCDRNGILIWQDFAMGCASYPQTDEFASRIAAEAEQIVRKYRNHCSLALWAGDNECDIFAWKFAFAQKRDPNTNRLTRKVLPQVLQRMDQSRPYLPSSPYVDETAYRTGLPTTEEHTWGPRDYFKGNYYRNTVCRFVSEVGYHGCPEPNALRTFLSSKALWPWRVDPLENTANREWLAHATCPDADPASPYAYRIPLMSKQILTLFGTEPETLDDFAAASQISQAEAKKFFIESFRIQRAVRTGVLWWNLIDGWPQISDAIVDYYGNKKLAYAYIKRAQAPVALMCDEPNENGISLYGVSDLEKEVTVRWSIKRVTDGVVLAAGESLLTPHSAEVLSVLPYRESETEFYLMEWEYEQSGKAVCGKNHFVSGLEHTVSLQAYKSFMQEAGLTEGAFFFR